MNKANGGREMRNQTALAILISTAFALSASAQITIGLVGDGDGYDENGVNAFRSTSIAKAYDPDSDNVYGSQGLFFFGDGLPDDASGEPYSCHTQVGADWATFSPGTNFASVAEGLTFSYAIIDDPSLLPKADVADWGIYSAGGVASTPAGAGSWCEILTFDIDETTPSEIRIGILAGNLNNVNWNPAGLRLSVDGGAPQAVTNLPGTVGQANFVFFDVALNGETNGTFSIEAQRRATTQGASIAGVTFDNTSTVTFPGGVLELAQDSLSLTLDAPDTGTNGTINALYLEGAGASDVEIVSLTADAGFSATVVSNTLGSANLDEAITVTFDNSAIGLEDGEATNSTLVVTWTEVGSGVTNTTEAALDVTYNNPPVSLALAPTSLSLVLSAPDTSTNGTIVASYIVGGTSSADIEIVSTVADSGFSASMVSTTLGTGNLYEDITVNYDNSGALSDHGDTASSTLVVTWTEAGSGVTNTANAALDIFYYNPDTNNIVVSYEFTNESGVNTTITSANMATSPYFQPTFSNANVTASTVSIGSGLNSVTAIGDPANANRDTFQIAEGNGLSDGITDDMAAAWTAGDYIEFTITAAEGYTLDLENFTFNITRGANGCNDYAIRTSVDSFTNDLVFANQGIVEGLTGAAGSDQDIDLSGAAFQGLSNLTLRICVDDRQSNTTGGSAVVFDSFVLSGAVNATTIPPVSASVSDGAFVMSWEGDGTYNVLTNLNLAIPGGWGVKETGAASPVAIPISSAPAVFYKLSKPE
jgi:hypothetical protein